MLKPMLISVSFPLLAGRQEPGCSQSPPDHLINPPCPSLSAESAASHRMGGAVGAMGGPKVLLLVLLFGWEKSLGLNWNPIPRKTIRYQGE